MNRYRMVYQCSDGIEDEEIVSAANRMMAFTMFDELEIEDVINVDCYLVTDEDDEEDEEFY